VQADAADPDAAKAAVFRDASLTSASARDIPALVNVPSHQAQRRVRGALAYATAKSAIEGLTCAAAVDHGAQGIRVNAVALESITAERYSLYRASHPEADKTGA
jgi:NAD(P)-dependent dehydrogenase (short-subunit alcohol dehydrogenase family)